MKYKVTVSELSEFVDGTRSYGRETDIYTQIVEDVDIRAVIDAVNGPKLPGKPCTCKGESEEGVNLMNPHCPTHGIRK